MNENPLSIAKAAEETPDRISIIIDEKSYTFADIAALVEPVAADLSGQADKSSPSPIVGRNDLDTLIRLYALFEIRTPALLLHPRWSAEETGRAQSSVELGPRENGRSYPAPAVILFTSGTTGAPRGVALSASALVVSAAASEENLGWEENDSWLLSLPVAHVGGLSIITRSLLGRRVVVLADCRNADGILSAIERHQVTLLSLVPTMLRRILECAPEKSAPSSLRAILLGGGPIPSGLIDEAVDRRFPLLATYGMTETCSQIATQPYAERLSARPVGAPLLPGIEARIENGRIEVRGKMLMDGYLSQDMQARSIDDDGWFATDDSGTIDNGGRLHVLGRTDEVIITGGENVNAIEVERAILGHTLVKSVCVFGQPDKEWGEVVCAAIVPHHLGAPPDHTELNRYLSKRLAGFKKPRYIAFVDSLPENETGGINRLKSAEKAAPYLTPLPRK